MNDFIGKIMLFRVFL